MNILREVRKVNQKSMPVRIMLLLTFCVIFTISTYAWFITSQELNLSGLEANVTSWDVAYYVDDNEILKETVTLTIDSFYPGMSSVSEEIIHIYNLGDKNTNIKYELLSVKLFGEEVINDINIGISGYGETGKMYTIFSEDTQYPFNVNFTYDKSYLEGKYVDDNSPTSEKAHATFKFNASWEYQAEDEANTEAKDALDTQFGKAAFEYYKKQGSDPSKAIEIQVKITSSSANSTLEN